MKLTHIHGSTGADIQDGTSLAEESQGCQKILAEKKKGLQNELKHKR